MKATKRSRPGRRLGRKHAAWFPLRRPALLAALGLAGWVPAGAADFPPTLGLAALDGTNGFRLDGDQGGDQSGRAVSRAGDVNGDGIEDLLIGAPLADPTSGDEVPGASYVVFGRDTTRTDPFPPSLNLSSLDGTNGFRLNGVAAGDRSGYAVSPAGDVNGDGIEDLRGPLRRPQRRRQDRGELCGVRAGHRPEVLPGASLNLSSLDGSDGFRLNGAPGDNAGSAVSGAGDVNGDGIEDLLIGAPGADPNGADESGASYVVFGRNTAQDPFPASLDLSDLDVTNGFRLNGAAASDLSGSAVSGAGDVNGDGIEDLLIGAPTDDGGSSGASYVVFGRNTAQDPFPPSLNLSSLDGSDGFRLNGADGDRSGSAVSPAGDVNGDGLADLLIGAPGPASGASYVVFGRDTAQDRFPPSLNLSDLDVTNGFRLNGADGDHSGSAVSGAGDVNGDGLADLLIGATGAKPNGADSGASYVVFGRDAAQTGLFPASLNLFTLDGRNGFRLNGVATCRASR